ncbi:hypothetical protein KIW84_041439 [Lathyrus oleraceus]|uniref:Retrovirus-related Pol polyprotein from transposon TNT 1-94-like beta-barrel domain-containing protein n=1 Tax=Pisum sativum TaxID=3888 RepID=A0A9D4XBH1_PEA|nr:hypothetical protein KIW84_041439 [Pisum sativum]
MDLDDVDIILLAHELHLNKFNKSSTPNLISLNLAQAQAGSTPVNDTQTTSVDSTPAQISPSPNVWTRPHMQPRSVANFSHEPSAFVANSVPSSSASWFPDYGASFHITNYAKNIQQLAPFEGPYHIFMGNGQGLDIQSSGSSVFSSPIQPHTPLTLHNFVLIPTITKNLISASQFYRDNHVQFLFTTDKCLVQSEISKATLLEGSVGMDGLYEFPSTTLSVSSMLSPVSSSLVMNKQIDSSVNALFVNSSTPNK